LKHHLLAHILTGGSNHPDYNEQELCHLQLYQDRMYQHHMLHINYTSYDVFRHQDTLNPSTVNCFALLPADLEQNPDVHPYIYAQILGVYHAKVTHCGGPLQHMDFVHVRWLYYNYD
jgi:hypothetical protein